MSALSDPETSGSARLPGLYRSPTGQALVGMCSACVWARGQVGFRVMARRIPTPRYLFGGLGQLSQARGALTIDVTILNISAHGCRVNGLGRTAVGEVCELGIQWQGKEFRREVKLRWKNRKGEGGLEFLSMDETGLAFLRELFATLQLEPSRPLPPHRV